MPTKTLRTVPVILTKSWEGKDKGVGVAWSWLLTHCPMCGGAHDHVMPVTADPRQYLGKPSAAPCRLPSRGLGKLGFVSDEDSYILKDDFPTRTALELAESADFLIYAKQEEQRQTSANRKGDK